MSVVSAGLLLYRQPAGDVEVLLAHPGGPYWRNKNEGAWSIPKGEIEAGEEPLAAAFREFAEEIGIDLGAETPSAVPIGELRQSGGKRVIAFALAHDVDPAQLRSTPFEMEWPPRSGRRQAFPEVDRVAWFDLPAARTMMLASQRPFLDRLMEFLGTG